MTELYHRVFIGCQFDARNKQFLETHRITHIINCTHEIANFYEQSGKYKYKKLGMEDNQYDDLSIILEPVRQEMETILADKNNVVLVHCSMGISRSATVIIYYLMKLKKWRFAKTLDFVRKTYSYAKPNQYYQKYLESVPL